MSSKHVVCLVVSVVAAVSLSTLDWRALPQRGPAHVALAAAADASGSTPLDERPRAQSSQSTEPPPHVNNAQSQSTEPPAHNKSSHPAFWVFNNLPLTFRELQKSIHYPVVATLWEAFETAGFEVRYYNVTDLDALMLEIPEYVAAHRLQPFIWNLLWEHSHMKGEVSKFMMRSPTR
eukprot:5834482-Amphidinium_carterae.1